MTLQSAQESLRPELIAPELAIIVPTFCERDNVDRLIVEVKRALMGVSWEIVFVDDDSSDQTAEYIRTLAPRFPNVRCIQRIGRRGLSSACIEGILSVSAPVIAVMDADLQHETLKLRDLLAAIRGGADLAVGSRVAQGGSFGSMSQRRQWISTSSSKLAKSLLSIDISDPMSGFFMLRRSLAMRVMRDLSGLGFKILLDILTTMPSNAVVVEIPYEFRGRHAGESKLDSMAALDFALLLADKTIGKIVPTRFLSFCLVGGLGVVLHFLILTTLFKGFGSSFTMGQTAATGVTMIFNFFLNNQLTFRDYRLKGWRLFWGLLSFLAISTIGAIGNVGIASVLFTDYHAAWAVSALAGILISAVWNYAVSKSLTWRAG